MIIIATNHRTLMHWCCVHSTRISLNYHECIDICSIEIQLNLNDDGKYIDIEFWKKEEKKMKLRTQREEQELELTTKGFNSRAKCEKQE